jgi:E3 ubiquitin-protein ligase HECTD1
MLDEARSGSSSTASIAGARREDHYPEFRIGRIKHERIKVERSDNVLWENAIRVMKFHAARKAVLEIEYVNEEGTGLGPTLEFYALVAAEFQRKSLGMWLCDDSDEQQQKLEADSLDLGEGIKPPGYYVRRSGGLFPAPAPQGSSEAARISDLFRILGIFLAKVLQDGRLVDLPLSLPFLRLLISNSVCSL